MEGAKAEGVTGSGKEKTDGAEVVHLRRSIGLLSAISFIFGTVVGSGIFIAPKGVLMNSGSVGMSLLVWGLCGVLSTFGEWARQLMSARQFACIYCMLYCMLCRLLVKQSLYTVYCRYCLG